MPSVEIGLGNLQIWECVMCRQIVLVGLAAAILLSGCKLQKEEPVAQQKSVGRILDAAFQGRKGLEDVATYVPLRYSPFIRAKSVLSFMGSLQSLNDIILSLIACRITTFGAQHPATSGCQE